MAQADRNVRTLEGVETAEESEQGSASGWVTSSCLVFCIGHFYSSHYLYL